MADTDGPADDQEEGAEPPGATTPAGRRLTEHARESLRRHGFKEPFGQVDDIMDHPTRTTTQADGATVYIQRAGPRGRKYNIVIEGDEGVVTGMRDLSKHELDNLGRRYGFNPHP
jgi:filamentous hemagglutinin